MWTYDTFQDVKGTFGSVKLIRDEAQESALLPDVYLKEAIVEQKEVCSSGFFFS